VSLTASSPLCRQQVLRAELASIFAAPLKLTLLKWPEMGDHSSRLLVDIADRQR